MPRCCSNIFLNQFTQQPPDVIVDPPGANFCYFWEDFSVPETSSTITMDYVTIDGVQTAINKEVFIDWGFDLFKFSYQQVVTDLTAAAATTGVAGMGFFIAYGPGAFYNMRFSVTGENITDASITYTYDEGAGPVQTTTPLQSDCAIHYDCFEASYTPEDPFLIENATVVAVSNTGLTLFETPFFGNFCEYMTTPGWLVLFEYYIKTLHGTQASVDLSFVGNTATVKILNTLLHPAHMDNQADSGCVEPSTAVTQNNFTLIDCP